MGYCIYLKKASFRIVGNANIAGAQKAISDLFDSMPTHPRARSGSSDSPAFAWVNGANLKPDSPLPKQLAEWRWYAKVNEEVVSIVDFTGEKLGNDDVMFEAIAPFVESGSYIQMRGEGGETWQWVFEDGKFKEEQNV